MEQWSPSSRSYGAGPNGVDMTSVKNSNGNHIFVGRSQPRPLDLPPIPVKDATKKKKKMKKRGMTSLFLSVKLWTDPEMKRKRRVAKYKMYSAEGKLKASFKKGFRWMKRKCSRLVHGF